MISEWQQYENVLLYIQRVPDADRLALAAGTASGLAYLHGHTPNVLVHGDLKPENILVSSTGVPKLTDFGLSIMMDDAMGIGLKTSENFRGTILYADPVLLQNSPRSVATDLWALGWVIFELFTGLKPYWNVKHQHLIFTGMLSSKLDMPSRRTFSKLPFPGILWPIIEGCWRKDPVSRLPALDIAKQLEPAIEWGLGLERTSPTIIISTQA